MEIWRKIAVLGRKIRSLGHYNDDFSFLPICEEWMSPPDEQCVRSCLNDHPEAFRFLVERYQAPLMRRLCMRLGNAEEAVEAAQETFVRAYFALRSLKKAEAFFPWLLGIGDRVVKETHRAAKRRKTVSWEQIAPDETAAKREACVDTEVAEAVANLPETYRDVIVSRFYEGQSCDEISRESNVPLGTVTKRLSRAYGLLRECLGAKSRDRENEVSQ